MTRIFGPDVSYYQDDDSTPQQIDFVRMKNYGASFVILKVGQWYYPDPDFKYNWRSAKEAGLPRGGYWFGDRRASGKSQAVKYWDLIKDDPGEGIHFVDYENGSWTDWNELFNFISEFQSRSGLPNDKIGIYTGYYWWFNHSPQTNTAKLSWFAKYNLWLAWYTDVQALVKIPRPWTRYLLWQKGTPKIGPLMGVESLEIDYNEFMGTDDEFKHYFGKAPSTPQPPPDTGENMFYDCKVTTTAAYVNLRQTPNGLDIGDVPNGTVFLADKIEKDSNGADWLHSVSPGMVGWVAAWLCQYKPVQSGSEDYPVKVTVQMASGKIYVAESLVQK